MKNHILWIAISASTIPLNAQYITIRETDQSGTTRDLMSAGQAIDINSELVIHIQRQAIFDTVHAQLAKEGNKSVDTLISKLKVYKTYIEKLEAAISVYSRLFEAPEDSIDLAALRSALQARARVGIDIVKLFPDGSRFRRRREEELSFVENKGSNENFRILMRLLAEEMQDIEKDLLLLRKEAGYAFQLAAWSVTARGPESLHLEGFDDLPPGEYFEYERNRLYLTEEQLNELNGLTAFFEDQDRHNVFEKIADILPGLAARIVDEEAITLQINLVKERVNALITTATEEKKKALEKINGLEEKWKALVVQLNDTREKYIHPDGVSDAGSKIELLRDFMSDFTAISQQVKSISDEIHTTITSINFDALGSGAVALKNDLEGLFNVSLDAANQIINHARESYHLAVYGRRINAAALELSEEVLKLAVDDIPQTTSLDLHYTGEREPGDKIIVKAMIGRGNSKQPFQTEVREMVVLNALPHLEMGVAYAFAKPVSRGSNFKGGPLVSVLYKFKSHSLAYRNFLDPGIGLHAASYDFNNDDTPEFAGGVVVSVFRDYVQGGWGFNFNSNSGYWFVGIRIPLPTMPVSLMGNQ